MCYADTPVREILLKRVLPVVLIFFLFFATSAEALKENDLFLSMGKALRQGKFSEAIIEGERLRHSSKPPKGERRIDLLILLARAHTGLGFFSRALEELNLALTLSKEKKLLRRTPEIRVGIANSYLYLNLFNESEKVLDGLLDKGEDLTDETRAQALNVLGTLYSLKGLPKKAVLVFQESFSLARKGSSASLSASVSANLGRVYLLEGKEKRADAMLTHSYTAYREMKNSRSKAYGLLNIARSLQKVSGREAMSVKIMESALLTARKSNDRLAESYANGYLGGSYEKSGNLKMGREHTERAIFLAQNVDAPEALYSWQWQNGRLLAGQEKIDEALISFRNAIKTLQSVRQELLTSCKQNRQISYETTIEPLYFGFADLLLKQSETLTDEKRVQEMYQEVRETIELLRGAELEEYLEDPCILAERSRKKSLEEISGNTAVLYLLPFEERVEILVGLKEKIIRKSVPLKKNLFFGEIDQFAESLRYYDSFQYMGHAQKLYSWLIAPIKPSLIENKIETLVFISHGPLRKIPLAALHTGEHFLIRDFKIAVTQSLNLTDPKPLETRKINILLGGVSEAVQGFPSLDYVSREIESVKKLFKGDLLLNENFREAALEERLKYNTFSILHLASHAEIQDTAEGSYILTWDKKLGMNDLEELIGYGKFRHRTIDLLTLSACVTAEGSDRAALGLAGVAMKAGARSALASLWNINDESTYKLITAFYESLSSSEEGRAGALKAAQEKLLDSDEYSHPFFWAPFLLIGNWL